MGFCRSTFTSMASHTSGPGEGFVWILPELPSKWKGTALSHQAPSKHGICAAPSWARWAPVLLPVPWGRGAPGASLLPLCWCELSSVVHRYTCTCYISVYTCVDGYICVFACWLPVL